MIPHFPKYFLIKKGFFIFLLFCLQSFNSKAQTILKYQNLVMEGGGIKGIAYGGALQELDKKGILHDIKRVAGTSAGAIQACLLSIGYTPKEIIEIVNDTPIESFNDDGFVSKATKRLFKEYGWFRGDSFLQKMEQVIYQRTGNADLTFEELHHLASSYPFRDLYVTGTNLTNQSLEVFSYENYPKMRIADAVRISMSIPLYYRSLWVDKQGNIFDKKPQDSEAGLFVDGGLLLNFPIDIFDDARYIEESQSGSVFNPFTLGLRLEKSQLIEHELSKKIKPMSFDIVDMNTYMDALGGLIMRNINPPNPRDVERTVYINDLGLSARVRKVPEAEKSKMMQAGRQAVAEFFNR